MPIPGGWELILILVVLVLLFGAKKLPDMARSIGQSARVFKGEMKGLKDDGGTKDGEDAPDAATTTPAEPPAVTPPAPLPPAATVKPEQEPSRIAGQGNSSTGQ